MKKFTIILLVLTTLLVACQANEENRLANKKQENALNENNTDDENVKKNASIEEQAKQMIYHVFKVGNMSMDDTIMNTYYDKKEKSISFTVKGRSSRPDDSSSTNFYKDTAEAFRQLASLKDSS